MIDGTKTLAYLKYVEKFVNEKCPITLFRFSYWGDHSYSRSISGLFFKAFPRFYISARAFPIVSNHSQPSLLPRQLLGIPNQFLNPSNKKIENHIFLFSKKNLNSDHLLHSLTSLSSSSSSATQLPLSLPLNFPCLREDETHTLTLSL